MGEMGGGPGIGQDAAVEDGHGIVIGQILETVGHGDHETVAVARYPPEQSHDLLLRLGVQPACHLIAEKDRGTAHQFHGQGETALLTSRKNLDAAFRKLGHSNLGKEAGHQRFPLLTGKLCHP